MTKTLIYIPVLAAMVIACGNPTERRNDSAMSDSTQVMPDNAVLKQDSIVPLSNEPEAKSSADPTSAAIQATKQFNNLSELYKSLEKKAQIFSITTGKDTTLSCAEGTTIYIKANSFVSEKTGNTVKGSVQISIKEYYKFSDMLLARLSTTSNNQLLETAGMLNITATSNNENLVLKKGETVEIGFPAKKEKEGMQLYNGTWKDERKIDWVVERKSANLNSILITPEEMPSPANGASMESYIRKSIIYPAKAIEKGIQGTVYVSFIVDKRGKIRNVKLLKGIDPDCDQAALSVVKSMPKLKPGRMHGRAVNVLFTLPVRFTNTGGVNATSTTITNSVKNNAVLADDEPIEEDPITDFTVYLFASYQLGWINCDRWANDPVEKVNYLVDLGTDGEVQLDLIFHKFKSIFPGHSGKSPFLFSNVPVNEKITLVAIKLLNKKLYLAIKETSISSIAERNLVFQEATADVLKEEIKKLDRFN